MAKGNFEEISAGALVNGMPSGIAAIVNVLGNNGITSILKEMYPTCEYKVYIVETSYEKLPQVLQRCNEAGMPAIVLCGNTVLAPHSFLTEGTPYSAAVISDGSYGNMNKNGEDILSGIISNPYTTNLACIGYQGYYFSPEKSALLGSRYFEEMRLGAIRDNITLAEPLLRNSNYCYIDLKSVRYSDYPLPGHSNPNGMFAQELCQIARYIGFGLELKAAFLYSLPQEGTSSDVCSRMAAETLWHLCEALSSNIIENPYNNEEDEHFIRKIVSMGENGEEITFVNSSTTDRWWMEILSSQNGKPYLVPCSINDYKAACCGEIPIRWLFFYQKLAIL